ncbi:MAG: FtsX-like permease family protein [Acidobacteria bacterium]|nr:FtsX-like permease family protein [Acidobacteriota bacterium]
MRRPPFWFRWILLALPRSFRRTHGAEIAATAEHYASQRGLMGRTYVWARAALDVAWTGLATRLRAPGRSVGSGRGTFWDPAAQDLRHAVRSLRADARFVAFVTLVVGLGIGASLTVFNVAHAMLLKPLPFSEPDRLVWVSNGEWGRGQALSSISVQVAYVQALREASRQLEDVAGYHLFDGDGDRVITVGQDSTRATRLRVTTNFLDVLGIRPEHGRLFTVDESVDDGPAALVLTHRAFVRRFDADPSIVGQAVFVDDEPVAVVGVMPPTFDFEAVFAPGRSIDYIVPFPLSDRTNRSGNTLGVIGRLAADATVGSAAAETEAITAATRNEDLNDFEPVVRPLHTHIAGGFTPSVGLLVAAVGLVMLIVCANLSNLLLARGATRGREMAVRAAIGAPRRRLIRQLLTESLLLSGLGAAAGLLLADLTTRVLTVMDLRIPLLSTAHTGIPAVAVTAGAALLVGVVFGIIPAFRGTEFGLSEALKESGRGSSGGKRQGALRSALVVSEVALACMLLIACTLLVRSFVHLLQVDLGYESESAVALRIDPAERFSENEARVAFYGEILERVRGVGGVESAGLTDRLPMGFNRRWDFRDVKRLEDRESRRFPFVRVVSDGYLDAMGSALVAGRDFGVDDDFRAAPVAMINLELADELWPDGDAIGERFRSSGTEYEIIGIVRGTRQRSVDQGAGLEIFLPLRQVSDHRAVHLVVRGDRALEDLITAAQQQIRQVNPTLALDQVTTLDDVVAASIAPQRFLVGLLTAFAVFAVTLASLGIYGVIAYSVVQRRREIGIHIALGATRGDVEWTVVRQTLGLALAGLVVGLLGAVASARLLESLLYGIQPIDAGTYAAAAAMLAMVAAAAGYFPARRASRANPLESLAVDAERQS